MKTYLIQRNVPGAGKFTAAERKVLAQRSCEVLRQMGSENIQWLHSYVTEDKVYCIYLAPDEDTILEHARRTKIPADRVAAVRRLIDPNAFR